METLRGLSKEEAKTFTECCKNSFCYGDMRILISLELWQNEYGLHVIDIMKMNDCGLINDSGKSLTLAKGTSNPFVKDDLVYILTVGEKRSFSVNLFSKVGQELSTLVPEKKVFSDEQIKLFLSKEAGDTLTIHQKNR